MVVDLSIPDLCTLTYFEINIKCNPFVSCHLTSLVALLLNPPSYDHKQVDLISNFLCSMYKLQRISYKYSKWIELSMNIHDGNG